MSVLSAHWSFTASTWAQVFMLALGAVALVSSTRPPQLLKDVLVVEMAVQVVELVFYVWILKGALTYTGALKARYADWVFTTPLMLVSAMALFSYRTFHGGIFDFVSSKRSEITRMLAANFVMLAVGLLYTAGRMRFWPSQVVGFLALVLSFRELHSAVESPYDAALFWSTFALWAAYGLAVHYPVARRNVCYNVLDVFSKNVVGVYVAMLVLKQGAR